MVTKREGAPSKSASKTDDDSPFAPARDAVDAQTLEAVDEPIAFEEPSALA